MVRRPPRSTRTETLFPYTTLFRSTIRMTDSTTHIVFLLFPGITQLDFTAPAQALCRMPGAVLAGAAARLDPIATDSGFAILPQPDFASAPQADILRSDERRGGEEGGSPCSSVGAAYH